MTRNLKLTRTDVADLAKGAGLGALSVTTYVLAYLGIRGHFGLEWMPVFSTPFVVFAVTVAAGAISLTELSDGRTRRTHTVDLPSAAITDNTNY